MARKRSPRQLEKRLDGASQLKTPSRFSSMVFRCLKLVLLPLLLLGCQAFRSPSWDQLADRYMYPTSHMVEVDGVEVHLRDEGEGPVILLLHGASASLHTWDPWVQALREDYRVLSVDLPPSGLTGPHPDDRYDPQAYLSLLDGILNLASVDQVILVGNSLGGHIAAR